MKILVEQPVGTVVLRAPAMGVVRWTPPAQLCGELDVFDVGDSIVRVGDEIVEAPARGFVLRELASDGAHVQLDEEIAEFRIA
jgi:hypothetical protein